MHPAHLVLTPASKQDAADALHWSYADRLFSHSLPIRSPFSQEECQELIRLLNSAACILPCLAVSNVPLQILANNLILHTRAWSRESYCVSVRAVKQGIPGIPSYFVHPARWRQVHFKRHRPLLLRAALEIVVGVLSLGIPFLFIDRARYTSYFDMENNTTTPSSTPLFVIGACACLAVRTTSVLKIIP